MSEIQLSFTSMFEELLHEILVPVYEAQTRLYIRGPSWSLKSV